MRIVNQDPRHLPAIIDSIVELSDIDFAPASFDIANKLADAQHSRSIPGGILVIFTGSYGQASKRFIGVIKAEVNSGYEKQTNLGTGEISLKFVQEILLTPGTKLYKTAAFFEKANYNDTGIPSDLNEKWAVMVSDYQISKADGKAAAKYFYSDFLGAGYPETSARTTKLFYEKTTEFIDHLEILPEKKSDLHNALNIYLKAGVSSVVDPAEFASQYFDNTITDEYTPFLEEAGLPTNAFTKDLEHIQSRLKTRRVKFSRNVSITAPSEIFKEYIKIESIEGDLDEAGNLQEWTQVTIKDKITSQK
jgi:hypothetical protein